MMIGVLVKLNIKEGSEKDFEENMLKLEHILFKVFFTSFFNV